MSDRKIVVMDAGHGGKDTGTVWGGRQEKDDNLKLTLASGKILAANGVDVRFTRTDDTYNTPLEKARIANEAAADYFVSLHRSSKEDQEKGSGVQTLVFEDKGSQAELAKAVGEALEKAGFANLGTAERPGLVVLKRSNVAPVLVEAGFIDNDGDNELFDKSFDEVAKAIADGVLKTIRERGGGETRYYEVQTGAYRVHTLAESQAGLLKSQGFPAFVVYEEGLYKVRVGAFQNLDYAVSLEQDLKKYKYDTIIVRRPAVD